MQPLVSIVTGAGRGIGLATALRLARRRGSIALVARNAGELATAAGQVEAAGGKALTLVEDVAEPAAAGRIVAATVAKFGRLDLLVNNAGVATISSIEQLSDADFERLSAVNMSAVFRLTRAAWPVLRGQGGGVIVNISSVASVDPFPGLGVYGASKAWVSLFTKAAAEEGRACGIRVFAVAPGAVETKMLRDGFPDIPRDAALAPDQVASVIESLASDELAAATGQTVFVRK